MSIGGGSSSSQQEPARPVAFNPLTGVLLNLFGVPTRLSPGRGGIVVGNPMRGDPAIGFGGTVGGGGRNPFSFGGGGGTPFTPAQRNLGSAFGGSQAGGSSGKSASQPLTQPPPDQGQFANQVFFPEDFGPLRDQLDPALSLLDPETFGSERLAGASQIFDESVTPGLRELAETGFRTDISPIVAAEQNRLLRETVPSIRELAAANTGAFSTDFQRNLLGAGSDLGFNLGALQAELDEAAAGRRVGGLQLASGLPLEFASDVLGFQEEARASEFSGRPGTQVTTLLNTLAGVPTVNAAPGQIGESSSFNFSAGALPGKGSTV